MIRLKDLLMENRKRINKAKAQSYVSDAEWKAFVKKLKETYPRARPTFWSDGGKIYAQIGLGGGSYTFLNISGQYGRQD